ncbi:hypothetical protein T06_16474, partial [Trichinella sp. T6]
LTAEYDGGTRTMEQFLKTVAISYCNVLYCVVL